MKQLIDGSGKVAERLFRDLLLAVARAGAVSERIDVAQGRLPPRAAGRRCPTRMRGSDDEALAALVRELRELTAQQKDTWLKYTSGNRAALEPVRASRRWCSPTAPARLPNRDIQVGAGTR